MMRTLCRTFAGGSTTIFGSRSRGATIVRVLQAGIGTGRHHRSLPNPSPSTSFQISTLCVSFNISEPTTNVSSATPIG